MLVLGKFESEIARFFQGLFCEYGQRIQPWRIKVIAGERLLKPRLFERITEALVSFRGNSKETRLAGCFARDTRIPRHPMLSRLLPLPEAFRSSA